MENNFKIIEHYKNNPIENKQQFDEAFNEVFLKVIVKIEGTLTETLKTNIDRGII